MAHEDVLSVVEGVGLTAQVLPRETVDQAAQTTPLADLLNRKLGLSMLALRLIDELAASMVPQVLDPLTVTLPHRPPKLGRTSHPPRELPVIIDLHQLLPSRDIHLRHHSRASIDSRLRYLASESLPVKQQPDTPAGMDAVRRIAQNGAA